MFSATTLLLVFFWDFRHSWHNRKTCTKKITAKKEREKKLEDDTQDTTMLSSLFCWWGKLHRYLSCIRVEPQNVVEVSQIFNVIGLGEWNIFCDMGEEKFGRLICVDMCEFDSRISYWNCEDGKKLMMIETNSNLIRHIQLSCYFSSSVCFCFHCEFSTLSAQQRGRPSISPKTIRNQ